MKKLVFALLMMSTAAMAEDTRQLVVFNSAAQETLRQEMRDNLFALHEVLALMAVGQVKEAGEVAESKLGVSSMGKHRLLPPDARPGPQMPQAMHAMGIDGHKAASEFASVALSGDKEKAQMMLPKLSSGCVTCHASYRTR